MYIKLNPRAPEVALNIEETVTNIKDIEDYALTLQLVYREAHSIFYFKDLSYINFDEYYMEVKYMNNTALYLNYENILEYCIVNAEDLKQDKREYI